MDQVYELYTVGAAPEWDGERERESESETIQSYGDLREPHRSLNGINSRLVRWDEASPGVAMR